MKHHLVERDLAIISLIATAFLYACSSQSVTFEGNPMPEAQVVANLKSVTPSTAYDTPPKFLRGYAPFFPSSEAKLRQWGYALVEFNVTTDGTTGDIRVVTATAYSFAARAARSVQNWRFKPARKNGQPVPVRMRIPFTFRT